MLLSRVRIGIGYWVLVLGIRDCVRVSHGVSFFLSRKRFVVECTLALLKNNVYSSFLEALLNVAKCETSELKPESHLAAPSAKTMLCFAFSIDLFHRQ